ncbi:hypothetical protein [Alienimonas californiensis]|uniref:Uncharacterized protein n=1 Tax=Alienimonas californiensis TaxID=2527989 RepID=A0A517PFQ1_9PLAN|nr:hypothetical protein [Alienimonas californiensis]QDT18212.1 hypothetical protein CA12_43530 [Alienimonas californiensis]
MSEAPRELAEPPKRGDRPAFRIGGRFATVPGTGRWGDRQNAYELQFQSAADGTAVVRCVGEPWFDRRTATLIPCVAGVDAAGDDEFPRPPNAEQVKQALTVEVEGRDVGRLFRFGAFAGDRLWYADDSGVSPLKGCVWQAPGGWTRWTNPTAWLHQSFGRTTVVPDSFETTPQVVLAAAYFDWITQHRA